MRTVLGDLGTMCPGVAAIGAVVLTITGVVRPVVGNGPAESR